MKPQEFGDDGLRVIRPRFLSLGETVAAEGVGYEALPPLVSGKQGDRGVETELIHQLEIIESPNAFAIPNDGDQFLPGPFKSGSGNLVDEILIPDLQMGGIGRAAVPEYFFYRARVVDDVIEKLFSRTLVDRRSKPISTVVEVSLGFLTHGLHVHF